MPYFECLRVRFVQITGPPAVPREHVMPEVQCVRARSAQLIGNVPVLQTLDKALPLWRCFRRSE